MEIVKNKVKAVMLGHAVGDALGVPVEFLGRKELVVNPVTDMKGYGTYNVPAGSWSDDTSLSIAALDGISEGDLNYDLVMSNFTRWLYNGQYTPTGIMFDVGSNTSRAIDNYAVYQKTVNECGCTDETSNGNGSLMRIHPFVLMAWCKKMDEDTMEKMIESASALTHAHERSKLGCKIYAQILLALLNDPEESSVVKALKYCGSKYRTSSEYFYYYSLYQGHFRSTYIDDIISDGYVVNTLEAAVWCLLNTTNYKECVLKAVNLGDDTDTVGAVAGGLAGALYGFDSIPEKWLNTLIKREYIEQMCEKAVYNWC